MRRGNRSVDLANTGKAKVDAVSRSCRFPDFYRFAPLKRGGAEFPDKQGKLFLDGGGNDDAVAGMNRSFGIHARWILTCKDRFFQTEDITLIRTCKKVIHHLTIMRASPTIQKQSLRHATGIKSD
jgi:hypothetical protein